MRVSPDGNTRFARQENGQVLRMGMSKKLGGFGSGSRYITGYLEQSHFKSRMLENRNTIPKKNVTIEQ